MSRAITRNSKTKGTVGNEEMRALQVLLNSAQPNLALAEPLVKMVSLIKAKEK